jgi:hypothetical protein
MTHLKIYDTTVYAGSCIVIYTFILIGIMNCVRPNVLNHPYAWINLSVLHSLTNFIGMGVGIVVLSWYNYEYTEIDETGVIPVRHFAVLCIIIWLIATLRIYNIFLCRYVFNLFCHQEPINSNISNSTTITIILILSFLTILLISYTYAYTYSYSYSYPVLFSPILPPPPPPPPPPS